DVCSSDLIEGGQDLPDHVAIPLISSRVNKQDCLNHGWVLEGWPNTRAQALALQSGGILPTHCLYFDRCDWRQRCPPSICVPHCRINTVIIIIIIIQYT